MTSRRGIGGCATDDLVGRAVMTRRPALAHSQDICVRAGGEELLAAVVNTTVMAGDNLTVGSAVWLPAESLAPGR